MKKILRYSSILLGFLFAANFVFAQVPAISYAGSPYSEPVSTTITAITPTNSGGTVNGSYTTAAQLTNADKYTFAITDDGAGNNYFLRETAGNVPYAAIYKAAGAVVTTLTISGITLNEPSSIGIDGNGNLFVGDAGNGAVYEFTLNAAKTIATYFATIGTGTPAVGGIDDPTEISFDASNNIYISDYQDGGTSDGVVFKVAQGTTTLTTYITNLDQPTGVAVDASGNTYVSQVGTNTVVKINGSTRTIVAGTYTTPLCLTTDASGDVFIADEGDGAVKEVSAAGVASTLFTGIVYPQQITFDSSRNMYIADYNTGYIFESTVNPVFYTISGTLPTGLAFNSATGVITGTTNATVVAAAAHTVTAYNYAGISTSTVIIGVNKTTGVPTISYTPSTFSFTQGTSITATFPAPTIGNAPTSYTFLGTVPPGLAFSTTTGKLSGSPTAYLASTNFVISANNTNGSGYTTINISITGTAPTITYAANYPESVGTFFTITPTTTGTITSVLLSSALPSGLSISSTGVISGSISSPTTAGPYTATPYNGTTAGTSPNTFTIKIAVAPAFSYLTEYRPVEGAAVSLTPTVTAGSPTSYAETGSALGTLTFNTTTGTFGGTAPASTNTLTFLVTATNAAGLTSQYTVVIKPIAAAYFTYTNPAAYTDGVAIATLSPTTAYTLSLASINPALPAGLSMSAAGVITGTPTVVSAATVYTVYAYIASAGIYSSATVTISVVLPAPPATITYTPSIYNFTVGSANSTSTPATSGGTPTSFVFDSSTPAPTWLSISSTGVISGNPPTGAVAVTYKIDAVNAGGQAQTSVTITCVTATPPMLSYNPSTYTGITYGTTVNAAIVNGGGTVTSTYTVSSGTLPAGLTLNPGTGAITGTPSVTGTTTVYVNASNAAGSSATPASLTISVNPAPLTITINGPTKTYGTALTAGASTTNFTTSALVSPDAITSVYLTPDANGLSTTTAAGSAYNVTGGLPITGSASFSASNYTITYNNYAGTVATYPLSITANNVSKVTGTTITGGAGSTAFTTAPTTLPNGETVGSVTITYGAAAGSTGQGATIGTYSGEVTPSLATGGTFNPANYNISYIQGSIIVTPVAPDFSYTATSNFPVGTTIPTLAPSTIAPGGPVGSPVSFATPGQVVLTGTNGLSNPWGMASDSTGDVFVANYANATAGLGSIVEYKANGSVVNPYISGLTGPIGIALNDGNMYVLTTAGTILRYMGGAYQSTIVTGLTNPTGISIYNNNIYVIYNTKDLSEYSMAGVNENSVAGPSARWYPLSGVAVDPATGYVYTDNNSTTGGDQIDYVNLAPAIPTISDYITEGFTGQGIYIDPGSTIYEAQTGDDRVLVYSGTTLEQTLTASFASPRGVVTSSTGDLFVSDYTNNTVTEFIPIAGYYLSGTLPPGLVFNSSTGAITGKPTTAYSGSYTVTAYNTGGGYTSNTFTINCGYAPVFTYTSPDLLLVGSAITPLSPTVTGTVTSYSATLPPGLSIDPTLGTISGTPSAISSSTGYVITATNTFGSGTFTIYITCYSAPNIAYSALPSYPVNLAISPTLAPANTGGTITPTYGTGVVYAGATVTTNPWGMAFDASGNLYVADYDGDNVATKGNIVEFTSPTVNAIYINDNKLDQQGFAGATGIGFGSTGLAYVPLQIGYLNQYTAAGAFGVQVTGAPGDMDAIAIDASNNIYLADNTDGEIIKYNTAGTALLSITATSAGGTTVAGTTSITSPYLNTPENVAVDASGNIYVLDNGNQDVVKFSSTGAYVATLITGLSNPYGLCLDASGNIYVGDNGTGKVTIYNSGGVLLSSITGFTSPQGVLVDASGNVYVSDYGQNKITKYTPTYYTLTGPLPSWLTFSTTTGTFSGTPPAAFSDTYTVSVHGLNGTTSSTMVTITSTFDYDWVGTTNTDWNTSTNWKSLTVPGATNTANIGVNFAFTNQPTVSTTGATTVNVGAIQIGNSGGKAPTLTVASGYTLAVAGNIVKQSDANSNLGYTATLAGTGTISAASLNIIGSTTASSAYTETLASSVTNLNLSGAINLTSNFSGTAENAQFNLTGGTTSVTGALSTTNQAGSTSTFNISSGTLAVANSTFLSGLSSSGTNAFTLGTASVIQYAGAAQTVYTTAAITNLPAGISYYGIGFSGTGIKSVTSGNLNIAGNFTNTMTNDAADYVSLLSTPVFFNGTSPQSLAGGAGNGTVFSNVTFDGGSTATMTGGLFYVTSTGVVTMAPGVSTGTSLNAGGFLTLNSDVNGCASVAQIPSGCSIAGTVNVQRYISGERGYRLLSSPVYAGSQNGNYIYSINYLVSNPTLNNNIYLTGPSFTASSTTAVGNPSVYLYDEGFVPQYTTFYNSNFIAVSSLSAGTGTDPAYSMYSPNGATTPTVAGTYNIPVSNGVYVFFRGNMSEGVANLTNPSYTPIVPATVVASGTLTQGKITFADWYTPTSTSLGGISQNYNLIGNPYASAIDLNTIQGTMTNSGIYITPYNGTSGIAKFIYELNPLSGSYGIYTYDGSSPATNGAIEFIGSGEGFMVQAYGAGSQLIFNENAKAGSTNATNYGEMARRVANFNPVKINPLLDLKMSADSIHTEETILSFNPNASSKYVFNEDAPHKAGVGIVGISSMSSDNMKLAINTQPLQANMTIPLNVNATVSGLYNINLNQMAPLPSIYEVWLKDAYKKDSLDIKNNPVYNFDVNVSDTTTYGSNRFSLVIRENPALMVHLLSFNATKAIANVNVAWTTENEQNYTNFTVERSTDGGTTFTNLGALTSTAIGAYNYVDRNPAIGANMYRLMIVDLNGAVSYSNIVTIMFSNTSNQLSLNGMTVYPNPTANMVNLSITQTTSANVTASLASASYKIEIVNNLGVVVRNATSSAPTWTSDVTSLSPGTYFISVVNASNNAVVGKSAFVKL